MVYLAGVPSEHLCLDSHPDEVIAKHAKASVLTLTWPLVISFWMRAAFTFVDTIYASTIGDAAVAAIGLTVPFEFLMIAVWAGVSTGLTSNLSRVVGSHEEMKFKQYVRVAWAIIGIVSPLFLFIGAGIWFYAPHLDLAPDVQRNFQIYGAVLIGGSAGTAFWSIIPDSIVKAYHDTRTTMWAGIYSNLINVTLNTIFLFVFHWGIFGIALSTILGRVGGLIYALIRARQLRQKLAADPSDETCVPDPKPYRAILALAIPASLSFVLMSGETAFINFILASFDHATEQIAAYSIFYRVLLFALQPVIAAAIALLPYTARSFGDRDYPGIRRGLKQTIFFATAYAFLFVGPVIFFSASALARLLAESPISEEYTRQALFFVPLATLLGAPFFLCRPVFEGMNRGKPGLTMAFVRYVILTGPLAWLGTHLSLQFQQPILYGLIISLLLTSLMSSSGFYGWLYRSIPR